MTSIELQYPGASLPMEYSDAAPEHEGARRWLNVLVASVAIVLTAPLMVLVALLVRFTSSGPILYTQTRIGVDRRLDRPDTGHEQRRFDCGGKPFRILKFRTMFVEQQQDEKSALWADPSDPRVTPVGRWLRRLRLDELPQLFNVLTGDMNVVGPRPEQPKIFNDLKGTIAEYGLRQAVRPGITGLAQINQSYDQTIDDVRSKVVFDLEYIRRESVVEDLRIMFRTIPVIMQRRGV